MEVMVSNDQYGFQNNKEIRTPILGLYLLF